MKLRLAFSVLVLAANLSAALDDSLKKLIAIGREGEGNEAATAAWNEVVGAGPSAILAPIDRTTTVALPLTDGSLPSPAPAPAPQGGLLETGKSPRAPLGASGTQPVRPRMHPGGSASPSRAACTTSMRFVPPSTAPFKSGGGKHDVMGLCVDETETTVVAYRKCVEKGVCTPPAGLDWRSQARDRYPISGVTWDQAVTFCKHQSKRLPTEWEWEWVARGREENHPYPWGNTPPHCGLTVMLGPGGRGCGRGAAAEVGRRLGDRTRDGVVDMGGNLSEWTASAMREDRKSVRGGSFIASQSADFSVSHRRTHVSTHQSVDIGFRCVRSPGKGGKG